MTAPRAERALDALNLFLSDVRYGPGAYLAVYLLERHAWDGASIGVALSAAAMAGLLAQAPIGVLVDKLRAKRALVAAAAALVTATCLLIPLAPGFWPVAAMQAVSGASAAVFPPTVAAITLGVVGSAAFARRIGRNEAFNHGGNAACNVVVGAGAVFARARGGVLAHGRHGGRQHRLGAGDPRPRHRPRGRARARARRGPRCARA